METPNHDAGREPARDAAPSVWLRVWLWIPDGVFRLLGAAFFINYAMLQIPSYRDKGIWGRATYYRFVGGAELWIPWGVLVDLTYLLIGLAFLFRTKPLARARRAREIVVPLVGGFWPFLPFAAQTALRWLRPEWEPPYARFMFDPPNWTPTAFLLGSALVVLGNLLDLWGYAVLFRSLSIVAEARELKVRGPYRLVRHPIYLGQMLAQAGVWLCYAKTHAVWIAFYAAFVAMQLYRSRVEDQVLARAFGPRHAEWRRKTWWFF